MWIQQAFKVEFSNIIFLCDETHLSVDYYINKQDFYAQDWERPKIIVE